MTRPARALSAFGVLTFGILVTACGKKGPPLAPLRIAPAAVTDLSARRMADRVVLRFTLPARNDDNSTPADVARVDVYALSVAMAADVPAGPAFLEKAPVVGAVTLAADAAPQASFTETLSAQDPGKGGESHFSSRDREKSVTVPLSPVRVYAVVGVSSKGRRGAAAGVTVPLVDAPPAPSAPTATYSEKAIAIQWPAAPAGADVDAPKPLYNVYEAGQLPAGPPINAKPLDAPAFDDSRLEFGAERCYAVTTVRVVQQVAIESAPSPSVCVTPVDTFAPPAPDGLGAVAGPGSISLIWNAVEAADLAGYVVLRGEVPDDRLQALTPEPIRDTTYTDTAVRAGVRYIYAVVAVDRAKNLSPQSARVEETAR